jgi:hypothetical protein
MVQPGVWWWAAASRAISRAGSMRRRKVPAGGCGVQDGGYGDGQVFAGVAHAGAEPRPADRGGTAHPRRHPRPRPDPDGRTTPDHQLFRRADCRNCTVRQDCTGNVDGKGRHLLLLPQPLQKSKPWPALNSSPPNGSDGTPCVPEPRPPSQKPSTPTDYATADTAASRKPTSNTFSSQRERTSSDSASTNQTNADGRIAVYNNSSTRQPTTEIQDHQQHPKLVPEPDPIRFQVLTRT